MKQYIFRDNIPQNTRTRITPRKIGLLSVPVALSMLMMYCGQKVNSILHEDKKETTEHVSPDLSPKEIQSNSESWTEAQENQVLTIYRVKQGDTLSAIARKHGVTLESILKINPKITHADAIKMDQTIIIPYDGQEESAAETYETL